MMILDLEEDLERMPLWLLHILEQKMNSFTRKGSVMY